MDISKNFIAASDSAYNNLNYLRLCIADNNPSKMRTIFNSELKLLPKEEVNLEFLRELFDTFHLALGKEAYNKYLRKDVYLKIRRLEYSKDKQTENMREYLIKENNFMEDRIFTLQSMKYLYGIFFKIKRDYSYDLAKINIIDWEKDFYEYCKNSSIWKFVHKEHFEVDNDELKFNAINAFFDE